MNWKAESASGIRGVFATQAEADAWALRYEAEHDARTCVRSNFGWQITQTNEPVSDPPPETPGEFERRTVAAQRMSREEARTRITDLLGGNE